ncbi:iron-sulfur protein [Streptomyces sp. KR80]|uniref:iron-sulfur protein n=1 Tax=Streptomyces sp. KR80 TaxID=3457426 RepID=UPI003FCFB88F
MTTAPGFPAVGPGLSASSLLTDIYRRLTASCDALDVRVADRGSATADESAAGEGWVDGAELAQSAEALDAFVDAEAARIRDRHGHPARRDVAASRALHAYLWSVSLLMSGVWYLERRVPRIRPQDVRLDLATGAFQLVPGSGFACLPNDPAASRVPGVRVLVDEEALRTELRAAVADHVRPLLTAMGPHLRRGPRALWGMAGDDLISGIWYLGRMLDQEQHAIRAATELLPKNVPPFPGRADFRRLTGRDGQQYPTRTRLGCCLYYTLHSADACLTCPRTCDAERLRRLEADPPA